MNLSLESIIHTEGEIKKFDLVDAEGKSLVPVRDYLPVDESVLKLNQRLPRAHVLDYFTGNLEKAIFIDEYIFGVKGNELLLYVRDSLVLKKSNITVLGFCGSKEGFTAIYLDLNVAKNTGIEFVWLVELLPKKKECINEPTCWEETKVLFYSEFEKIVNMKYLKPRIPIIIATQTNNKRTITASIYKANGEELGSQINNLALSSNYDTNSIIFETSLDRSGTSLCMISTSEIDGQAFFFHSDISSVYTHVYGAGTYLPSEYGSEQPLKIACKPSEDLDKSIDCFLYMASSFSYLVRYVFYPKNTLLSVTIESTVLKKFNSKVQSTPTYTIMADNFLIALAYKNGDATNCEVIIYNLKGSSSPFWSIDLDAIGIDRSSLAECPLWPSAYTNEDGQQILAVNIGIEGFTPLSFYLTDLTMQIEGKSNLAPDARLVAYGEDGQVVELSMNDILNLKADSQISETSSLFKNIVYFSTLSLAILMIFSVRCSVCLKEDTCDDENADTSDEIYYKSNESSDMPLIINTSNSDEIEIPASYYSHALRDIKSDQGDSIDVSRMFAVSSTCDDDDRC